MAPLPVSFTIMFISNKNKFFTLKEITSQTDLVSLFSETFVFKDKMTKY